MVWKGGAAACGGDHQGDGGGREGYWGVVEGCSGALLIRPIPPSLISLSRSESMSLE